MAEPTSDAAPAPATDASNTPDSRVDAARVERRLWPRIKRGATRTFAIATALSTIALAIWIAVLLTMAIPRPHSLVLAVVTVPDSLDKSGFTDKVVTQRLADAIRSAQERADTWVGETNLELRQDTVDIVIPKADLSLNSIAGAVRHLFPTSWFHDVSGEITENGKALSMRLRLNGRVVVAESVSGADGMDALIDRAAIGILKIVSPYAAGAALFTDGDLAGADAVANEILDTYSVDNENYDPATFLKGQIAMERKHDDAAVAIFTQMRDRASSLFGIGLARADEDRFPEAIEAYRAAIALKPPKVVIADAENNIGSIMQQLGKDKDAIVEYREAIRSNPKSARPHYGIGIIFANQGKDDAAIAEYRAATRLDPMFAAPHDNLGNLYIAQGKYDDAIAEFREAIRLDPKFAEPHNGLGNSLVKQGNDADAITEFFTAIRLDRNLAAPHFNIAMIWMTQGKTDDAMNEFRAAIQLDSRFSEAYFALGNILVAQGKNEDAVAQYGKAIELAPNSPRYRNNLGNALYNLGKYDDASAEYRAAVLIDPKFSLPHNGLGNALAKLGKLDDAIKEYRKAIVLDPHSSAPYFGLGHVWVVLGKWDDAARNYRDAIQLDPRNEQLYALLGDVLIVQSKYDDAVAEYRQALQLEPDNPALHYALGSAFLHIAQSETSSTSRTSSFDDACAEFMQGAQLTHAGNFSAAMHRIDRLLPKGQRCPPDSLPKRTNLVGASFRLKGDRRGNRSLASRP